MNEAVQRVAAVMTLILLSPLLLVVGLLVWASLGRPIFFRQERAGYKGRSFRILKFRTLRIGPGTDAERLTPIGHLLRATSLDELPELLNVAAGQMNLVGPRPLLMEYLPRYSKNQSRRHDVKPGLTGWAQVNGRNATSWEARLALDCWYVEHRSWKLDALILWRTPATIWRREGVDPPGNVGMSEFTGSNASGEGWRASSDG